MIRILAIIILLSMCISVHAGGLYKWKDEKGRLQVTDYLPDGAEEIKSDGSVAFSKMKTPDRPNISNEKHDNSNRSDLEYINKMNRDEDSKILAGQHKYDLCVKDVNRRIWSDSVTDDIKKSFMIANCKNYLVNSKHKNGNDKISSHSQTGASSPPKIGAVDQYGVFYPSVGGNLYIDTRTGKILVGH